MNDIDSTPMQGFIAVHAGAGYHAEAYSELYMETCKKACKQAVDLLLNKKSALDAVEMAISIMEDAECTNAGIGSNLTLTGCVECDASIMDGKTLQYGAVGAVSGMKNPVSVASALLRGQMKGHLSYGRVPPCFLCGKGAFDWAISNGFSPFDSGKMVTGQTLRAYTKHRRKLDQININGQPSKVLRPENICSLSRDSPGLEEELQDTVGAVCVDNDGNVAAAVSSGGIILKHPGRVGQAAVYGAGCWAQNGDNGRPGVAVSTSGCGEHLIKTVFAKECAVSMRQETDPGVALSQSFKKGFLESELLTSIPQKLGGALTIYCDETDGYLQGDLMWAHTTESMCLGYMAVGEKSPKGIITRLPDKTQAGKIFHLEGRRFTWK